MKKSLFTFLFLVILLNIQAQHSIIPEPIDYQSNDEIFVLKDQLNFNIMTNDKQTAVYAEQFKSYLKRLGVEVVESNISKNNSLIIKLYENKNENLGDEGYLLNVGSNSIELTANKAAGIFNGFQSLKQMLPVPDFSKENETEPISILGCKITDYPRFAWRGLMLDVGRYFFTVDEVKEFIDKMSQYKFNTFHWHLTDDSGWRIEIKSFPELTDIGAWRVERHGRWDEIREAPKAGEKATDGGFYSQEEIKEVVKYAADRNVTIIPEIETPGHSMAALAAYPELSVSNELKYVSAGEKFSEFYDNGGFDVFVENTLNPTDERVYDFLDKVFTEVAELFPAEYIHMGGDEAYHGFWERDSTVQSFMSKNKIADGNELQSYFVKRVEKIINSKGKTMIGWDEILQGGLADNAVVMSWRGMKGGVEAAKMGHQVIMSPNTHTYLDFTQGDISVEKKIYKSLSLEKTYDFEPVPEGIDPKFILGGQGCVWTEEIPTLQFVYYMTYPRAFALSESLWSKKESKNWNNFIQKTENHFQRFETRNTSICKAIYEPIVTVYNEGKKLMCKLTNSVPGVEIFYTINGTYPVYYGTHYTEPFEIPYGHFSLRTQSYRDGQYIGRELIIPYEDLVKRLKKI